MVQRLLLSCLLFSKAVTAQDIGSHIDEIRKQLPPGVKESVYQNTVTLSAPANLHGLQAEWNYRFTDHKLDWKHFHKYLDDINAKNFERCLQATKKIIKTYTTEYGRPDTILQGNTRFLDPFKKRHWGYEVLEARWYNYKGMKINVAFTFMGGKGDYHFLVKVNYFDKDYPYFD